MKSFKTSSFFACLFMSSLLLSACSTVPSSTTIGPGGVSTGGAGPYTIGGTVTGLTGTGLILQDNGTDNLTITGNTAFTFSTTIAKGLTYNVSVFASPTGPVQTCTVANGSGTATANVTNVLVTCSTGTVTIGGTVVGLVGTGLTLQNNGGSNLSITGNGPFTFATAVTVGSAYLVTVLAQPTSPVQTCTVTNGSGTATASVGNIQVTCSTGTLSIGGTVTGLDPAGSGLVLQDNGGDDLAVKANGNFTFPTLLASGSTYTVTILTQPTGPGQACTVTNGTGTVTANVTNVQVICPAVFYTIGGTVVGLVGMNSGMVLQDNLGDNLTISGNGTFTFNTAIQANSGYDVSIFVGPNTQPQGCVVFFYQGMATSDITSVVVDCGHNDWAWFDGSMTANVNGSSSTPPAPPPPPPTSFDVSSPGGRKYPATWTDCNNNLWLLGGYGYTSTPSGLTPPTFDLNDMWEYTGTQNYFGGYYHYWNNLIPADSGAGPPPLDGAVTWTQPCAAGGDLFLFSGESGLTFLNELWRYNIATNTWIYVMGGENQAGVYGTKGTPAPGNIPGSRWGATTGITPSGTVFLFGGYGYDSTGTLGVMNDLWNYDTATGQWTWVSGSNTVNQIGDYGTLGTPAASNVPGARQSSVSYIDLSGNFWLFGGFVLDSQGKPDALNDLWEFTGGEWTWMSGANVVNQLGIYGTQGVAAATNVPGARWNPAAWTDAAGNFWLYGGEGFDSASNGSLTDLWKYNGSQWIWTKGAASINQAGIYGLMPGPIIYPYVGNNPGSRYAPGYWYLLDPSTNSSEFWMFGGEGFDSAGTNPNGLLSDLWRYLPYP